MRTTAAILLTLLLAACVGRGPAPPHRYGITESNLSAEFEPCTTQGKGPGCITPSQMQDLIGFTNGRTVVSVVDYGATTTATDNSTAFSDAINSGAKTVFIPAGTWNVCSQVSVPVGVHIIGYDSNPDPGSNGPNASWSNTIVTCGSYGTFSNGQAFFALTDHDVIEGITIYGLNQGDSPPELNCINALNAVAVTIRNNSLIDCYEGISRYSDGDVPGASESYSQLARIEGNMFYGETDHGYYATGVNGGFVTDEIIGPNNDFIVAGSSQIYYNGGGGSAIFGNRIEDQNGTAYGIDLESTYSFVITGNLFDHIQSLFINNTNNLGVAGNRGAGCLDENCNDVEFAGTNGNISFAGNEWEGWLFQYKVDAGATVLGTFADAQETIAGHTFADANTQAVLRPLMVGAGSPAAVSTQTASSSSALQWTGLTGNDYRLVCTNLVPSTGSNSIELQFGESTGPTWEDASYDYYQSYQTSTAGGSGNTSQTSIVLTGAVPTTNGGVTSLSVDLFGLSQSVTHSVNSQMELAASGLVVAGGDYVGDTNPITAIQLFMASGNIASGSCTLYSIN